MAIEVTKLKDFDFTKQLAFAYLTCERLYPNYVYFSDNYNFGNPKVLREAIDFLHQNIFEKNPDAIKINSLIKKVDKNTPDTGDFSTILVSSALDACTAIQDSLDFLMDKDFSKIIYILTYATDTVDMYIREMENIEASDKNLRQKIDDHPLMKKEIFIQQGIITFLRNTNSIDYTDLQTLLRLQDNKKKGSLGL